MKKELLDTIKKLLDCCELNMDDMEEETLSTIQQALEIIKKYEGEK